jgi:hypothetical protein
MNRFDTDFARLFRETKHLTLATTSRDGQPWGTPLHFASDGQNIYWANSAQTVHTQNLRDNPRAFLTIMAEKVSDDAHTPAAYIQTTVTEIARDQVPAGIRAELGADEAMVYCVAEIGELDEAKSELDWQNYYFRKAKKEAK